MNDVFLQKFDRFTKTEKTAFFSAIIFGLITHLHIFSVNYIFHDSTYIDTLGASYSSGRWGLGLLETLSGKFAGIWQLPFINGFICIFFIAIAAMMIVNTLGISQRIGAAFVGMVAVSFPVVASHFAFMFTATAYLFAMLLSMFSVFYLYKKPSVVAFLVSSVMLGFSLGIYQAYLSFAASFALVLVLTEGLKSDIKPLLLIKKSICFLAMMILGLIIYLAANKMFLALRGIELTSYQGLNNIGIIDFSLMPRAIRHAYAEQFVAIWLGVITSPIERDLTRIINFINIALFLILLWKKDTSPAKKLLLLAMFCLLPLAFNLVYPMSPGTIYSVHALMRYSLVFTYILPVVFWELLPQKAGAGRIRKLLSLLLALILWLIPVIFCYRDNTAYLNAELSEEQAESYYTSLLTRIRSTEGYRDELPMAYIDSSIFDSTLTRLPTYGKIHTYVLGFSLEEMLEADGWDRFCSLHLGWSPAVVDNPAAYAQLEEVQSMPCYPDDGSIKVIDGAVVVKFN